MADAVPHRAARAVLTAGVVELCVLLFAPLMLLGAVYYAWVGALRVLVLVLLGVGVMLATSDRLRLASVLGTGRGRWVLLGVVAVLLCEQTVRFVGQSRHPHECLTDMGRPSICAGEWLLAGKNPWAECLPRDYAETHTPSAALAWCLTEGDCIDRKAGGTYKKWKDGTTGLEFMHGYKYGPLLALVYLPLTHGLREVGVGLVNLVFWFLQLALVVRLGTLSFTRLPDAGLRALLVFLLPGAIPTTLLWPHAATFEVEGRSITLHAPSRFSFIRELTLNCANDVIPVALVLLALVLAARRRSLLAGVVLGLSLGLKALPAFLLLPLVVRLDGVRWRRLLVGAGLAATVIYLPFFAWAPEEMFANLVRFHLERPTNRSSLQRVLPADVRAVVGAAQLTLSCIVLVHYGRLPAVERTLAALLRYAAVLLIGFVAFNKVVHGNYLLWIQPFTALAMAALPFAPRSVPEAHGVTAPSEYSAPP